METARRKTKNKEIDILPAVAYAPERERYGLYTIPYYTTREFLFVRDDSPIKQFTDLINKTLVIPTGYSIIYTLKKQFPGIKILEVPTIYDAITAVLNKTADATMEVQAVMDYLVKTNSIHGLKTVMQKVINPRSLHMLVRDDYTILSQIINKSIESITGRESSTISQRWLISTSFLQLDYLIFIGVLTFILFIILSILFWNRRLAFTVNKEVKKRRYQELMLMEQSRLASMGEMIGNIAHQWRQPLSALSLVNANIKRSFLADKLDEEKINKQTDKASRLIQQMSNTINDFSNFFKPDKEKSFFTIKALIDDTKYLIDATLHDADIKVIIDLDEALYIEGFYSEFSQVIINIISNAKDVLIEKAIEKPFISIKSYKKDLKVFILISDNAGGINPSHLTQIFDPYFTTKEEGKGTGIGLYMSKMIIDEHVMGTLKAYNSDVGAVFEITLPLSSEVVK